MDLPSNLWGKVCAELMLREIPESPGSGLPKDPLCSVLWCQVCTSREQPWCPSVGEWIHEPWYIQTTEYYSALKKKKLSSHEKSQRNFTCILWCEKCLSKKSAYYMTPRVWYSGEGRTVETVKISGKWVWEHRGLFRTVGMFCEIPQW